MNVLDSTLPTQSATYWKEIIRNLYNPYQLHESLGVSSHHVDTIVPRVTGNPAELLSRDEYNNLPIHVHLSQKTVDVNLLQLFLRLKPEIVGMTGRFSRTPLHCVMVRARAPDDVVNLLLEECPESAQARTTGGWTPMHYAADHDIPSITVMKKLMKVNPLSASTADHESKLPLHWCVDRSIPSIPAVCYLSSIYPDGVSHLSMCQNAVSAIYFEHWTPIEKCLAMVKDHPNSQSGSAHLLAARIMMNADKRKLRDQLRQIRRDLNWEARCDIIMALEADEANHDRPPLSPGKHCPPIDNFVELIRRMRFEACHDLWVVVLSFL